MLAQSNKSSLRIACTIFTIGLLAATHAIGQEDKKTDEDKPADPDTGESTVATVREMKEGTAQGLAQDIFELGPAARTAPTAASGTSRKARKLAVLGRR